MDASDDHKLSSSSCPAVVTDQNQTLLALPTLVALAGSFMVAQESNPASPSSSHSSSSSFPDSGCSSHIPTSPLPYQNPFACDHCSAVFQQRYNLNVHRMIHTGERLYLCPHPYCEKAFIRKGDMTRHLATIHTGEKRHKCKQGCGASFGRTDQRSKHHNTCMGSS